MLGVNFGGQWRIVQQWWNENTGSFDIGPFAKGTLLLRVERVQVDENQFAYKALLAIPY